MWVSLVVCCVCDAAYVVSSVFVAAVVAAAAVAFLKAMRSVVREQVRVCLMGKRAGVWLVVRSGTMETVKL